ncbi:MAG: tRNA (adenosine(37)-N6)-threonylcarbamoyltransferase complex dimerization subunit type 1 TsaB, partial [Ardenticatenaceae bacterium]
MLLALDSATRQAGLALYDGEVVRAEAMWSGGVYHTEWLAPAVDHALQRINTTAADLSAVAVTKGPGSFTGLRVAMSIAKGIAAARSLPLIGIATLDVTAYTHVE